LVLAGIEGIAGIRAEMPTKVLRHLIENTVEYCVAPAPRVHISSARADLDWVLSIADNGPDIDPAFQGRIFEVFNRLHGKEYPGNGLDWHTARKLSSGSRRPGAGSTFYSTLPAAG
jgi:light-regulated signal transduction histidine kinase (bacteriophytochrome)